MSEHVFSDDFDSLEVGTTFATRGRTITEADVVSFAALTGDWHPQHADEAWAARSGFGERIAHGMLLLSYAVGLVALDPARVLALRRLDDVVFKRAVGLGETVHVEGELEALKPVEERSGLVTWRWSIVKSSGETAVRARVQALWRRGEIRDTGDPEATPTQQPAAASAATFTPLPL